ncbi:hypothetical protein GCM10027400_17280 [Pseudoxanthomonas daejeonensis]
MCTPSPIGARVSLPLTRLPEAEAMTATACCAVLVATGGAGAAGGVLLQAARTASEPSRPRGTNAVRMVELPAGMDEATPSISRMPVQAA